MIQVIETELRRLAAPNVTVRLDREFEPEVGELVEIRLGSAYWHLVPDRLLALLKDLPDRSGGEAIRRAIEENAVFVWHGPAPKGRRDTSP